jgi:hypothetical protein
MGLCEDSILSLSLVFVRSCSLHVRCHSSHVRTHAIKQTPTQTRKQGPESVETGSASDLLSLNLVTAYRALDESLDLNGRNRGNLPDTEA